MDKVLTPFEPEAVEENGEHLEVVVLLVSDNVYHLVDRIVVEALFGGADVLCHVDRSAVAAQKNLAVEALAGEVGPYGAVGVADKKTFFKTFEHLCLAVEVCARFVINFVEIYAHALVAGIESVVNPLIHACPQVAHFLVSFFPAA